MTIYEHAMVGINGALTLGLQRRHGWQIVALAGCAAVLPDLDGLTILFGFQCYADGHRVWGHNLLVTGLAAAIVSAVAYYTDGLTRVEQWFRKRRWGGGCTAAPESAAVPRAAVQLPPQHSVQLPPQHSAKEAGMWLAVGVVAAYSHLLADIAFSAGNGQPIWGVPLCWPFSNTAYAYPMVRWGDIGATVILAASMFAMLRWPARIQAIAAGSLLSVAAYMAFRGFCG